LSGEDGDNAVDLQIRKEDSWKWWLKEGALSEDDEEEEEEKID